MSRSESTARRPAPNAPRPDVPRASVSPEMRRAKQEALAAHVTIGTVEQTPDGRTTIACSCGMVLTNGPDWSLDEHIRLHRAEARYVALSAAAPAGMPRLVAVGPDRLPEDVRP